MNRSTLCASLFAAFLWAAVPSGAAAQALHIGMVNAQTGPAAGLGKGMLAGAKAVFDEVNARGGVHGRKLVLHVADDAYEPDETVEQTLKLVQDEKVLALLGFVGTPTANAVLPLIAELDVPLVGVFSGAMSLRNPVLPHVFNVRASYDDETDALVERLLAGGAKRISVVYQNDGFGIAVLSGTEKALKKRGAAVYARASFQRNTVAVRMALATMVEMQPDAVVIAAPYGPLAAYIAQARALGFQPAFATVSFVGAESLVEALGEHGSNVLISQVVPPPGADTFAVVRECRQALNRHGGAVLGHVSLEGCISAHLLVHALQAAGPGVTRQSLIAALRRTAGFDLGGWSFAFSADNYQASEKVFLTRIERGRVVSAP